MASQSLNHHQLFQQIGLMDDGGDAPSQAAVSKPNAGGRPGDDGLPAQEVSESNNSPPEGPREAAFVLEEHETYRTEKMKVPDLPGEHYPSGAMGDQPATLSTDHHLEEHGVPEEPRELLRISVDLGSESQVIQVFEGQNPADIARDFAQRFNLGEGEALVLESQILENLEAVEDANGEPEGQSAFLPGQLRAPESSLVPATLNAEELDEGQENLDESSRSDENDIERGEGAAGGHYGERELHFSDLIVNSSKKAERFS